MASIGSVSNDVAALLALHRATGGGNWNELWDTTTEVNTWYGVTVNEAGRVVGVSLKGNNLRGKRPSAATPPSSPRVISSSIGNTFFDLRWPRRVWIAVFGRNVSVADTQKPQTAFCLIPTLM